VTYFKLLLKFSRARIKEKQYSITRQQASVPDQNKISPGYEEVQQISKRNVNVTTSKMVKAETYQKSAIFWDVTSCTLVEISQHFSKASVNVY
jgi:hypothetical protein